MRDPLQKAQKDLHTTAAASSILRLPPTSFANKLPEVVTQTVKWYIWRSRIGDNTYSMQLCSTSRMHHIIFPSLSPLTLAHKTLWIFSRLQPPCTGLLRNHSWGGWKYTWHTHNLSIDNSNIKLEHLNPKAETETELVIVLSILTADLTHPVGVDGWCQALTK